MKNIGVTIVNCATVSGVAGMPRVAWISRMANVSEVAEMFVDHHVLMQLSDVWAVEFVNVSSIELADCISTQLVNVLSSNETHCVSVAVVDIRCHG